MINPNLDLQALADSFKEDNKLKIDNFMQLETIERMRNACLNNVPFSMQYVIDGQYQSKNPAELANTTPQQAQEINHKIAFAAGKGEGFIYDGYLKSRVQSSPGDGTSEELIFLHDIFDYISSDEVLNQIKIITGNQDLTGAEPQYTRFTPGHFLTRHLDVVPGRDRRYAFVLGMTKDWHPDWGGLLQFYDKEGNPLDTWMPQFNVLSIFEVSHIHAVTYVTPFATAPRLSLTGWFVARS